MLQTRQFLILSILNSVILKGYARQWGAVLTIIFMAFCAGATPGLPPIIPLPSSMEVQPGEFTLETNTVIFVDDKTRNTGDFLANQLRQATRFEFKVVSGVLDHAVPGAISLKTTPSNSKNQEECYQLTVTTNSAFICNG